MAKKRKSTNAAHKIVNGLNKRFDLSRERAEKEIAAINRALREGHSPYPLPGRTTEQSVYTKAAEYLETHRVALTRRVGRPDVKGLWENLHKLSPDWTIGSAEREALLVHALPQKQAQPASSSGRQPMELLSRPDNTFLFGAAGDLHAASKYTRWDVREDLYKTFIEEGAQCNFDTGNWIDGEKTNINIYDLEVLGIDNQIKILAERHPKGLPTYAVWGDDHEGWYVQRQGINCGTYCEGIMRAAGHDWTDLGFMEAHVILRNANSGQAATMSVVHPGGGSAYALSYAIQKIVESLEGGEKPAVGLYGHYHKLWSGLIRNVWVSQTGCQQDQTPFMRKKRLEAHIGGNLIKLRQDPRTGAIVSMQAELIRYFNRAFHIGTGRWSRHGDVVQIPREKNRW